MNKIRKYNKKLDSLYLKLYHVCHLLSVNYYLYDYI
jgi:hypothetical protein